jgi:hypothetical protein
MRGRSAIYHIASKDHVAHLLAEERHVVWPLRGR